MQTKFAVFRCVHMICHLIDSIEHKTRISHNLGSRTYSYKRTHANTHSQNNIHSFAFTGPGFIWSLTHIRVRTFYVDHILIICNKSRHHENKHIEHTEHSPHVPSSAHTRAHHTITPHFDGECRFAVWFRFSDAAVAARRLRARFTSRCSLPPDAAEWIWPFVSLSFRCVRAERFLIVPQRA